MEKALGKDHLDLATTLTNLAFLFRDQGQRAKARPLYERALAIREKALGKDHADVGATLYNLAVLLDEQGAPAEARPHFERALVIDEQVFGKDSPELVTELLYLARKANLRLREIPVRWDHHEGSKVQFARDSMRMLREVIALRTRPW